MHCVGRLGASRAVIASVAPRWTVPSVRSRGASQACYSLRARGESRQIAGRAPSCASMLMRRVTAVGPVLATSAPDSESSNADSASAGDAPTVLLTGYAAAPGPLPDVLAATFPDRFPTLSAARKGKCPLHVSCSIRGTACLAADGVNQYAQAV